MVSCDLNQKSNPLSVPKNICDCMGQIHNGLNGTPLDPPLFWLDNTFKEDK